MSAYGTIDTAVEAMKLGATDYISKPFKPDEILLKLRQIEETWRLRNENLRLRDVIQETFSFENLVAKSKPMRSIFETIRKVADFKTTVLITGESGTGKELIARAIHYNGIRRRNPLVAVNCGGLPENLLESELFGEIRSQALPAPPPFSPDSLSVKANSVALEKTLIEKALHETNNNRTRAAKLLEISHPTLLSKMKTYGLS
jgi:DNA-binding NtrC family response regulator